MINRHSVNIAVNYGRLRSRLMGEYHYTPREVRRTVWRLMGTLPEVRSAFVKWFAKGTEPRLTAAGISWRDLVDRRGLNPFNAFLTINEIMRDPDRGMALLDGNMTPSLRIDISKLRPDLQEYVRAHRGPELPEPPVDSEGNLKID